MSKLFYIDVETTGTDPSRHGLVQIAGIIEIDGQEKERINLLACPFQNDCIDIEALEVIGKTEDQVRAYDPPTKAHARLINLMDQYVDRFDRSDKFHFVGYNSRFDDSFIQAWFKKLNDNYYGSWFHWPAIDVSNVAALSLMRDRGSMDSFKLMAVASRLGIQVEESKAHDALYDVEVTRQIFRGLGLKVAPL